jgi:FkbH-like protein
VETAPFRFSISATFTAEPLEPIFRFWEQQLAANFEVRFAPYNQVLQTLASDFAINRRGLNILLARIEDLGTPANLPLLAANFRDLLTAVERATPAVFMLCPPSPVFLSNPERAALARSLEAETEARIAQVPGLHYLSSAAIAELYPVREVSSTTGEALGRIPYTELYFCALASALVRFTDALFRPPYKVIALDCDDTLWQGICGEDGPAAVVPDAKLQQFMLRQHQAGMLLTIASKNNEQDVLDTFAAHPEMPLAFHHFAATRINWDSKPANLAALARELSLNLDTFIFVDDNAKEAAEAEESVPQVLSLALPVNALPVNLEHIWAFDHFSVTEADRKRNATYVQGQEFGSALKRAEDLQHFMSSLDLRLTFGTATPASLPRIAQLTQRTNQFNFSGHRRTESEFTGLECITVEVADRFGEYGLTGAALFRIAGQELVIDTLVLSCRVLGRGVEHALMARLATEALKREATTVFAQFIPTPRNRPAQQFLESLGPAPYRFEAETLQHLKWRPVAAEQAPEQPIAAVAPLKRPDYARIARNFSTADQIRDALRIPTGALDSTLTPTEQKLASLWADLLGKQTISAEDNFFDLGGHSLLMVRMIMRVREELHVELSVDDVYSATLTLADLARKIDHDPAEYNALLREIESLSDEEVERLLKEA